LVQKNCCKNIEHFYRAYTLKEKSNLNMAAFLGFIDCMTYMREIGERRGEADIGVRGTNFPCLIIR
jgi:hypothetical protein